MMRMLDREDLYPSAYMGGDDWEDEPPQASTPWWKVVGYVLGVVAYGAFFLTVWALVIGALHAIIWGA